VKHDDGQVRLLVSLVGLGAAQFMAGSYTQANRTFTRADEVAHQAPCVTDLMRFEAQLRKAGIRLYPGEPKAGPRQELILSNPDPTTGPGESRDDAPDSELERVAAVLHQYESGALSVEEARRRISAFMGSPALSSVKQTPTWLYDKLGKLSVREDRPGAAELPPAGRRLELE
jgi:hypothetical protein